MMLPFFHMKKASAAKMFRAPASGGHPPLAFAPFGWVGFIAWRLRRPKKGNADGAEGIFGLAGRVWASALRPDPP